MPAKAHALGAPRTALALAMAVALGLVTACGGGLRPAAGAGSSTGGSTGGSGSPQPAPVAVVLAPTTTVVTAGGSVTLTAQVSGTSNTGMVWSATGGTISGTGTTVTYTAPAAAGTQTVTATSAADRSASASARISVQVQSPTPTPAPAGAAGFTGLFQFFPSSSQYASSRTPAAMTANPWMRGARFGVNYQGLCQDTQLSLSSWNGDASAVSGYTDPMDTVMIRMNANPSGTWNIQSPSAISNMDAAVAGVVSVAKAAGTNAILLDLENYYTNYFLNNYNQTSVGQPILNSPYLTRAQMCAKMRTFGQAVGTSLWSRMPNATLYTFFGPTIVMGFTGGTGIPTSWPDANYANDPRYNMLPYFFLGMLDACPATGHIADYMERSYYDFAGLASIKRNMTASKNWVSIFFPAETAAIAKSATCWVPVPMIFANPYFQSSYGTIYPGAYYVKNATDQANYFTRNALYCLQQTPAGFLPGIYVENYDPWGVRGTVSNMPAAWETCLNNAVAVYNGTATLAGLFDPNALYTTLRSAFAGHSAWVAECQ